jgi:hypothetical protein
MIGDQRKLDMRRQSLRDGTDIQTAPRTVAPTRVARCRQAQLGRVLDAGTNRKSTMASSWKGSILGA